MRNEFPPLRPGHERHLLAIPFEVDFTLNDIMTAADPYESDITDEERTRRHRVQTEQIDEYHRRVGEVATRLVEQMSENPLARHGYLFGNPAEAKEMVGADGLTGAAYDEEFYRPES